MDSISCSCSLHDEVEKATEELVTARSSEEDGEAPKSGGKIERQASPSTCIPYLLTSDALFAAATVLLPYTSPVPSPSFFSVLAISRIFPFTTTHVPLLAAFKIGTSTPPDIPPPDPTSSPR
eukprot:752157-Hanusia_phi.AAC.1